ncbi:hypothetical protein [Marivita sp. XM-24bin2]|uniref:hypothetical protein n=1 Tax=Marivita sp. XM-24bin2 TaxID=2133951 RepID=UPI000D78E033|nr:hypothetical protein [Marivita sp. XM-24bin2]PWL32701.1 MAG: hypothetical protein DCO97_21205 [Marivita sp. XM-24bin2]
MRDEYIGALPVGESHCLVGMVTDRDTFARVAAFDPAPGEITAYDIVPEGIYHGLEHEEASKESSESEPALMGSFFSGMDFPAYTDELRCYAQEHGSEDEIDLVSSLLDLRFSDPSDVAKISGDVTSPCGSRPAIMLREINTH